MLSWSCGNVSEQFVACTTRQFRQWPRHNSLPPSTPFLLHLLVIDVTSITWSLLQVDSCDLLPPPSSPHTRAPYVPHQLLGVIEIELHDQDVDSLSWSSLDIRERRRAALYHSVTNMFFGSINLCVKLNIKILLRTCRHLTLYRLTVSEEQVPHKHYEVLCPQSTTVQSSSSLEDVSIWHNP